MSTLGGLCAKALAGAHGAERVTERRILVLARCAGLERRYEGVEGCTEVYLETDKGIKGVADASRGAIRKQCNVHDI